MESNNLTTLDCILKGINNVKLIMVRCNSPYPNEDLLFGYCSLEDGKLISLDGDNYYWDDISYNYEWENDDSLIVWKKVNWS